MKVRDKCLPAAPLQRLIRRHALAYRPSPQANDQEFGKFAELARVVALRLGKPESCMDRALWRVLTAERITLKTADEWCTALSTHVGDVFGWDVYENPFNPDEEVA